LVECNRSARRCDPGDLSSSPYSIGDSPAARPTNGSSSGFIQLTLILPKS